MRLLLVPSGNIKPGDSLAGTNTQERCSEALKLWITGDYDFVLLSGGRYEPPTRQSRPAAEIMYDWLKAHSHRPNRSHIILETQSRDTYQNVEFSLELLQQKKLLRHIRGITVVTESHHGARFSQCFHHFYPHIKLTVHATPTPLPWHLEFVEWLLLLLYVLDPGGQNFLARLNRQRRTYSN